MRINPVTCIIMSALFLTSGCASPGWRSFRSPLSEETRQQVRSVAVVPASFVPNNNFRTFAKSIEEGKAKGAKLGATQGAAQGTSSALRAGPLGILLLPFAATLGAAVGGATGAAKGASKSVPADVTQKIEAMIAGAVADLKVQEKLAERVVASGAAATGYNVSLLTGLGPTAQEWKPAESDLEPTTGEQKAAPEEKKFALESLKPDYRPLNGQGIDLVVETSVKELGFVGGKGDDPSIAFFITMQVRVVLPQDGMELYNGTLSHISRPRSVQEWGLDNAALVQREFETGLSSLAERTIEYLFLMHDFRLSSLWTPEQVCMLKPISPQPPSAPIDSKRRLQFGKTDSLTPTFAWEAFPRTADREADSGGILNRITDITYDLRVWKGQRGFPDDLVYERRGFTAQERTREVANQSNEINDSGQCASATAKPLVKLERLAEHTIDVPLEPSSEYYWSVRARFKYDGETRLTKWSHYRVPNFLPMQRGFRDPCLADTIPLFHYFRFKTPEFQLPEESNALSGIPSPSLAALAAAGAAEYKTPSDVVGKTFYTAVNIWSLKADKILSDNYHEGEMIPIGTRVKVTKVVDKTILFQRPSIDFVDDTGQSYTIVFALRHAKKVWDIFKQYFTEKDPLGDGGALQTLTPEEKANVKLGRIEAGMSKAAVIMARGYPHTSVTPSVEGNKWIYLNTAKWDYLDKPEGRTIVYFGDDRVVRVKH